MNRQAEIERIAYLLWCDEGCLEGRDLDHYFAAEQAWEEQYASQKGACEKLDAAEPRPSRKRAANQANAMAAV